MCDLNYTLFCSEIPPYSEQVLKGDPDVIHSEEEYHRGGAIIHSFEAFFEVSKRKFTF